MDDAAIREFLESDHERVVGALALVCGDRGRAEDAVQDALVDVWTKRRAVDDLAAWITTAGLNRLRSRYRTLAAERRAFERLASRRSAGADGSVSLPDAALARALGRLPRSQREAVALHYLLDLPVAEVARRCGVSDGTVKTNLHRARAALRRSIAEPARATEVDHA